MTSKQTPAFMDLYNDVTKDQIDKMAQKIAAEFDDRMTFENRQRPGNESIQKSLKSARAKMIAAHNAQAMVATATDPAFINRQGCPEGLAARQIC